jgi:NADH:ubiquinone oxidoreductase subunit 2 (subunit N)
MGAVLGVSAVGTMLLGIFPSFVLDWATKAASLHL